MGDVRRLADCNKPDGRDDPPISFGALMNTNDLRGRALTDQTLYAPDSQAVLDDLTALIRPRRRRYAALLGLITRVHNCLFQASVHGV